LTRRGDTRIVGGVLVGGEARGLDSGAEWR
jgi:hypothetical protein